MCFLSGRKSATTPPIFFSLMNCGNTDGASPSKTLNGIWSFFKSFKNKHFKSLAKLKWLSSSVEIWILNSKMILLNEEQFLRYNVFTVNLLLIQGGDLFKGCSKISVVVDHIPAEIFNNNNNNNLRIFQQDNLSILMDIVFIRVLLA